MSDDVTNEQLIQVMTANREAVLGRISSLENKMDKNLEHQHDIASRLLLVESMVAGNTKDINDNWIVTRKLDSRITKWGGIITALLFVFGTLLKFSDI